MMKKSIDKSKSFIVILIATFILSICIPYYKTISAAESDSNAIIKVITKGVDNGQIKMGDDIEITVDLDGLKNFYAGSVEYVYDNTLIEVVSIEASSKIKELNGNEAFNEVAKDGNKARYGFTFLGKDEPGISGQTTFVTIKAKAKKDGELNIGVQDMKFQLVQKADGTMKNMNFTFDNEKKQWNVTKETSSDGKKTQEKIELIGTSESTADNENEVSKDETLTSDSSTDNGSEIVKENDSVEKSFDKAALDNDEDNSLEEKKHNNIYLYIGVALGCIAIIACGTFILYRKKKIK